MFTAPRIRLIPTDGPAILSAQSETSGRKILHVSRAKENGGGGCRTRIGIQ